MDSSSLRNRPKRVATKSPILLKTLPARDLIIYFKLCRGERGHPGQKSYFLNILSLQQCIRFEKNQIKLKIFKDLIWI
jgi:hypothetical protein